MFLRLNVRFMLVKRVCLVLWFKPFKIPFSASRSLYRNNERNKKTYLSWCRIPPTEIPRFWCPATTAPVRTEGFFCHETVVILRREQTRPQEPSRRIFETSVRDSPARIFVFVRGQRVVSLSDKSQFVRQKCSLCEAGAFSRVKLLFLDTMETDWRLANRNDRKLQITNTLPGSKKSKISASTSCFAKLNWSNGDVNRIPSISRSQSGKWLR